MGSAWGAQGHVKNLHKHLHCLAWGTYLAFALSTQSYGAAPRRLPSVPQSDTQAWGEPLRWHSFFGHSFRFRKSVLASPSRRRGLGKGTAFESLSPAVL